jgi:hypothetical protein
MCWTQQARVNYGVSTNTKQKKYEDKKNKQENISKLKLF